MQGSRGGQLAKRKRTVMAKSAGEDDRNRRRAPHLIRRERLALEHDLVTLGCRLVEGGE